MNYNPPIKPISELIKQNPFTGIYQTEDIKECSQEELENSIEDIKKRLNIKLKTGRCSSVLIQQLARHHLQLYEKFGNETHQYHLPTILETLECFDNGQKMNVRTFNGKLLSGLMHIHHNSTTFRVKNIGNHWKEKCRIRFKNKKKIKPKDEIQFQNELLINIYNELLKLHPPEIAQEKAHIVLLCNLHNETMFNNTENQTGEWIVFTKNKGINYYLCLATHNEVKPDKDNIIIKRIEPCLTEFPELVNTICKS